MIPIIIPSYEPDERLIAILKDLDENTDAPVILVNDGSKPEFDSIFEEAESIIKKHGGIFLKHDVNRGKGRALKTAFQGVLDHFPDAIGAVTADSDGQHTVECIKSVSSKLEECKDNLILGVRSFDTEDVPWKSRMGNKITEKVFAYVAGVHVTDTQTGLRGIPIKFMEELLDVKGERFEFETRMLLEAKDYPIIEVPIKTVYDSKENHQTHFNPFLDSIKIYKILGARFLKYIFSALSSCLLDLLLFAVLCHFLKGSIASYIIISTVIARVISATYNYTINRKLVFESRKGVGSSAGKYVLLAVIQMAASAGLVTIACHFITFMPEVVIKAIIDTILFFISYHIQQKYVF